MSCLRTQPFESSRVWSGSGAPSATGAHVALFLSSLSGGGVQRSMLNLAGALRARGHRVDLIVCHPRGALRAALPPGVRLVALQPAPVLWGRWQAWTADPQAFGALLKPVLLPLKASRKLRYLDALARYLRRERPQALLSAMTYPNLVALWARRLAAVPTRLVVSERNTLSGYVDHLGRSWRWRFLPALVGHTYPEADAIVAVADGVADDLARVAHISRPRIRTIYNPVVSADMPDRARAPVAHPWFRDGGPPVVLGVGRLEPNKDFPTLLRAFARLCARHDARLLILGEGSARNSLRTLARELGIAAEVDLGGWEPNPFAYMARAALFVLSSAWEGLPGVLIQAMACGCPVVSTDSLGGVREVLEAGALGPLVPVGDDQALAKAMEAVLRDPVPGERLRARAALFSVERATQMYLEVLLAPAGETVAGVGA